MSNILTRNLKKYMKSILHEKKIHMIGGDLKDMQSHHLSDKCKLKPE